MNFIVVVTLKCFLLIYLHLPVIIFTQPFFYSMWIIFFFHSTFFLPHSRSYRHRLCFIINQNNYVADNIIRCFVVITISIFLFTQISFYVFLQISSSFTSSYFFMISVSASSITIFIVLFGIYCDAKILIAIIITKIIVIVNNLIFSLLSLMATNANANNNNNRNFKGHKCCLIVMPV